MPKLKLFRTASGFHDSYVAATSRAAALRAWGARTDLFAMGAAEEVDPEQMEQALARPGTLFNVRRGKKGGVAEAAPAKPKPKRKPPSRAALDKAEKALADLIRAQQAERADLDQQIARIERQKEKLVAAHDRARARKSAARDKAAEDFRARRRISEKLPNP